MCRRYTGPRRPRRRRTPLTFSRGPFRRFRHRKGRASGVLDCLVGASPNAARATVFARDEAHRTRGARTPEGISSIARSRPLPRRDPLRVAAAEAARHESRPAPFVRRAERGSGLAASGNQRAIGSPRVRAPSCTRLSVRATPIGLVTEARRNSVSSPIGASPPGPSAATYPGIRPDATCASGTSQTRSKFVSAADVLLPVRCVMRFLQVVRPFSASRAVMRGKGSAS
jgi:hypothetical protein